MEYEFELEILDEAFDDIDNIFYFYFFEKQIPEIANKFLTQVNANFESFRFMPIYQLRTNKHREYPIKKFPYLIFIEVNEVLKKVKVQRIFNTNQDPEKYP